MREIRFWDPKSSQNPDGFKSLAIQPETYAVLSHIFDQTLELENPPPPPPPPRPPTGINRVGYFKTASNSSKPVLHLDEKVVSTADLKKEDLADLRPAKSTT